MKLAVAKNIRNFCAGGDLCLPCVQVPKPSILLWLPMVQTSSKACFDGDGADPKAQSKLDFSQTFAFQNFPAGYKIRIITSFQALT